MGLTNMKPSETAPTVLERALLAAIAMKTREITKVIFSCRILGCDVDDNKIEHCD